MQTQQTHDFRHNLAFILQMPDVSAPVESYIAMSVSFNNKYLALFSSTGLLCIGSSDLQVALSGL